MTRDEVIAVYADYTEKLRYLSWSIEGIKGLTLSCVHNNDQREYLKQRLKVLEDDLNKLVDSVSSTAKDVINTKEGQS